jgi:hypothetical protein
MTPQEFKSTQLEMAEAGIIRPPGKGMVEDLSRLLGVSRMTLNRWERTGTPHHIDLACRALMTGQAN